MKLVRLVKTRKQEFVGLEFGEYVWTIICGFQSIQQVKPISSKFSTKTGAALTIPEKYTNCWIIGEHFPCGVDIKRNNLFAVLSLNCYCGTASSTKLTFLEIFAIRSKNFVTV